MSINVYWTRSLPSYKNSIESGYSEETMISPLRVAAPEPLTKHINYKEFFGPAVSRCVAIVDDIKNTYVIRSPVDMKIIIGNTRLNVEGQDLQFAQAFLGPPQGAFGIHQLGMGYLFFSEKSLTAAQLPAYYDTNSFVDNTFLLSASFDIGRWYRPAGKPAFKFKPGVKEIDIKEGDPLMYFKFQTSEKVKLIEFDNKEFADMGDRGPEWLCGGLKRQASNIIPLEKCYEYFDQYRMRKRILEIIKRNVVE